MSGELKAKAVRLLARREHSRAELARKLAADAGAEDIQTMLDELEQAGLLSDRRFAESLLQARAARFGAARLRHDLQSKGIAGEIIAEALPNDAEAELARARQIWQRKFRRPPADRADYARQARFLQNRGFAVDIIRKTLKEQEEE
ncbi:MAG: recombination regulator RecX [Zoogloeaceae bacterium]|nr:recombination regulator RecX [Zoogloeaceae bacterium]